MVMTIRLWISCTLNLLEQNAQTVLLLRVFEGCVGRAILKHVYCKRVRGCLFSQVSNGKSTEVVPQVWEKEMNPQS